MSPEGTKTNQVGISYNGETIAAIYTSDEWLETIDKFVAETRFPSRAAAIRSLVILGMREYALDDPRRSTNQESNDSDSSFSPTTIRELLPKGEENAISLKEDELIEGIDDKLLDIIDSDPKIKRDGWDVYR